jgi:ATP-binding cassette subfamily B protein
MRVFLKYFTAYRRPFYMAIFCVALEAVCDLLGPTIMARILDEGVRAADLSRVLFWGGVMLAVTAAGAVFALIRNALSSRVSQRVGADLRRDQFEKILKFSESSADRISTGSLITRMTGDINQVVQFVNGTMRVFLKAPITCLGSILLASILNFRLSLIVYGVVMLVAVLIVLSMRLSYPRFALLQKAVEAGKKIGVDVKVGSIYSSDIFYDESEPLNKLQKLGVLAVEMEAAALYLNAARAGKNALCLCTISDNPFTGEGLSAEQRQTSLTQMMEIALEVA